MSLDKAIKFGKEHREQYHDSRRFDPSCRSHGNCPWCSMGRKYKRLRTELTHTE